MAVTLFGLVTLSALIACPFLRASLEGTNASCCPRSHQKPACPQSKSLEICPFYISEAKIGIAKGTVQVTDAVLAPSPPALDAPAPSPDRAPLRDYVPATTDLHIRNRVLLI